MSIGGFTVKAMKMGLLMAIYLFAVKPAMGEVQVSRPIDGSTVREVVDILVPVSSVPADGFVIYRIDGRFQYAQSTMTKNREYYVYSWDTKALDPDSSLPSDKREFKDGEHTITVQACDQSGNKSGESKKITVYLKNHLSSSDLPSQGIRLRYGHKVGVTNKYRFGWVVDMTSLGGNGDLARTLGSALDGTEGLVKRSIEDVSSDGSALIRQQLADALRGYANGNLVPTAASSMKDAYIKEDGLGRTKEVSTIEDGSPVAVVFPTLPWQRVRIGDEWSSGQKVWWDAVSGKSVNMKTTNTFEGLEWQKGYPCAKIASKFSGTVTLPFSTVLTTPVNVDGETITYFCYKIGKVISSVTTATAKCTMDTAAANKLLEARMPKSSSTGGHDGAAAGGGGGMMRQGGGRERDSMMMGRRRAEPMLGGPGIGGPAGMEGPMAPNQLGGQGFGGNSGPKAPATSEVEFKVTESVQLEL